MICSSGCVQRAEVPRLLITVASDSRPGELVGLFQKVGHFGHAGPLVFTTVWTNLP
jgi:hypothetical protein